MPTSLKRASKQTAVAGVKRPVRTASGVKQPFLRFYHSESLRAKTLGVLNAVEKAEDSRQHRNALADLIIELTDSGMEYFFLRPLKLAKVGFFVEQSANLGMTATTGVMGSVIRKVIGGMDNPQLLAVCGYMRQLMK